MQQNKQTQRKVVQSVLLGVGWGIVMAVTFMAGFVARDMFGTTTLASPFATDENYPLLDEVQVIVDRNYLNEQPTYEQRQYAAIRGMLTALDDRYTFFIDPPVAQSESDVLAGTYGGVGVQIQRSETGDLVMYPFEDSPAAEAGIREGDILVGIDEELIDFRTRQDVIDQMLRGEVRRNNGVELRFLRGGDPSQEERVFVRFGVINVPSVVWRVINEEGAPSVGLVQVLRFTTRTPDEVGDALDELMEDEAQGLVLDLRGNSGGLLKESVDVASHFLDGGVVVYERDPQGERALNANNGVSVGGVPLVVLVDGNTASAAELVAGAIRDRERGILIGQQTFGKGTVQQIFRLSDESSLHVTSAEWLTPARNQIAGVGLEPDIAMIPDENGRDIELGEALRYISQQIEQDDIS